MWELGSLSFNELHTRVPALLKTLVHTDLSQSMTFTSRGSRCLCWNSWTLRKGCRKLSFQCGLLCSVNDHLIQLAAASPGFDNQDQKDPIFVLSC